MSSVERCEVFLRINCEDPGWTHVYAQLSCTIQPNRYFRRMHISVLQVCEPTSNDSSHNKVAIEVADARIRM
jgi:hypothetical protein